MILQRKARQLVFCAWKTRHHAPELISTFLHPPLHSSPFPLSSRGHHPAVQLVHVGDTGAKAFFTNVLALAQSTGIPFRTSSSVAND